MASSRLILVIRSMVTYTLFVLVRLVFRAIQAVVWQVNGTAAQIRESYDPRNYNRSAQVVDIVKFHTFCLFQSTKLHNFIYTHNRFEDPQYILDNDHISLLQMDDEKAVFVEAKEKDMLLWKSDYSAFMRLAQASFAKRLILVPRHAFHRLAEKVGDPKGEIIFLINTGRCGSTLFNQVFECTERCVAISEPGSPDYVGSMLNKTGDSSELRRLARDIIRLECRPYNCMQQPPLAYLLKLCAPTGVILPMLKEIFPKSHCMFMYRDTLKVAKSLYRLSYAFPSLVLLYELGRLSGAVTAWFVSYLGFCGSDYNYRLENDLTLGVLVSNMMMRTYRQMRRNGLDMQAVRYEELVARPLETCQRLMEYCGLPLELAHKAVRGLEVDSQRNTPISKEKIGNQPEPQLTKEAEESLNRVLKDFDLPEIREETIIEGTLLVNA